MWTTGLRNTSRDGLSDHESHVTYHVGDVLIFFGLREKQILNQRSNQRKISLDNLKVDNIRSSILYVGIRMEGVFLRCYSELVRGGKHLFLESRQRLS